MRKAGIDRTLGVLSKFVLALAMLLAVYSTLQAESYRLIFVSKAYDPEERTCSFWWYNSEETGRYSWAGEDVTIKVGEEVSRQLNSELEFVVKCERGHTTAFTRALLTSDPDV